MTLRERGGESGGQSGSDHGNRNATSIAELSCTDVRAQLNDLLDNSLDSNTRARLERHLRQCGGCAALHRTLEQTVHGLNDLAPVCSPDGMRERLSRRLKEQASG